MLGRTALAVGLGGVLCAGAVAGAAPDRASQLAFVRADSRLSLADSGGHPIQRLTREDAQDPAWSRDGSRIAYSTDATSDGTNVLVVATLRGPVRRIASADGSLYGPVWSPNGRMIAFVLVENEDTRNPLPMVGVVAADGRGLRIVGPNVGVSRPTWSPGSDRLAFAGPDGIRTLSPSGSHSKLVARGFVSDPDWSPRGTKIAFASTRGIEVVRPDGGARRVVAAIGSGAHVGWSPGGRTIAFDRLEPGATRSSLYEANPDGSGMRRLTKPGLVAALPAWSPDGRRIAFVGFTSEEGGPIYVMHADGSALERITPATDSDTEPVWRPRP
jgi:TolB protein